MREGEKVEGEKVELQALVKQYLGRSPSNLPLLDLCLHFQDLLLYELFIYILKHREKNKIDRRESSVEIE